MNASRLLVLPFALTVLTAPFASGCIIVDGGDDGMDDSAGDSDTDGNDSNGDGNDGNDSNGDGNDSNGDGTDGNGDGNDSADETGAPGGADAPSDGTWVYIETGVASNDCTFLEQPTNGWGDFEVSESAGGFTITPNDTTDPFECTSGSGAFNCPERLADEMSEMGSSLEVYVTVTGTLPSEDEMVGTQDGEIICTGDGCDLAEQLLATTFPCSFSVEFSATQS